MVLLAVIVEPCDIKFTRSSPGLRSRHLQIRCRCPCPLGLHPDLAPPRLQLRLLGAQVPHRRSRCLRRLALGRLRIRPLNHWPVNACKRTNRSQMLLYDTFSSCWVVVFPSGIMYMKPLVLISVYCTAISILIAVHKSSGYLVFKFSFLVGQLLGFLHQNADPCLAKFCWETLEPWNRVWLVQLVQVSRHFWHSAGNRR